MTVQEEGRELPFGRTVALHSLGWLVAANLVGVWLAVVILWPAVGDAIAPLTYGRWVPLHLDWQLYGWCALPLVGGLLAWCLDPHHPQVGRHVHLALGAWSLALVLGEVAWLGGTTSGRLSSTGTVGRCRCCPERCMCCGRSSRRTPGGAGAP